MPKEDEIRRVLNSKFKARNNGKDCDPAILSWMVYSFRLGYNKGQDDFMKSYDWYE